LLLEIGKMEEPNAWQAELFSRACVTGPDEPGSSASLDAE